MKHGKDLNRCVRKKAYFIFGNQIKIDTAYYKIKIKKKRKRMLVKQNINK